MSISVRLDEQTEAELRRLLRKEGVSLSRFVRDAVREKIVRDAVDASPFQLGEKIFGRYASGDKDRSLNRKEKIKERIHAKHCR